MKKIKNYEIISKLGEGGMGVVFKVKEPGKEKVAMKIIPYKDNKNLNEILEEVKLHTKLENENLVKSIDFFLHDEDYKNNLCLVMELCDSDFTSIEIKTEEVKF
jgi:serine/threonine protein kinase